MHMTTLINALVLPCKDPFLREVVLNLLKEISVQLNIVDVNSTTSFISMPIPLVNFISITLL